jgi:diacylglycerol kinase (ATP)
VNPAAARGGIRARLARIREVFGERGVSKIYETTRAGDEERLSRQAIEDGASTIVVVGGDGTCGRVADALLRTNSRVRLAVVPAGTGNDFAKTLGVDKYSPEQIADLVERGKETRIDVGSADGHYFLNSCGFGFDAAVLETSNRITWLKGDAVYIYAALRQLFGYRGTNVAVRGLAGVGKESMLMITVSNGRWLGGAFKIAPRASVLDGRLDVCFFRDSNLVQRLRLFAGALRGTHIVMPTVATEAVAQLSLTFPARPAMEMDGELRKANSKTIELRCVARALAVIAAPGALAN